MEFVAGLPMAAFINAAFADARPIGLNRFNGPGRGAWYAATEVETAIAEVTVHLTRELENAGGYEATVDDADIYASFIGEFLDLRSLPDPQPDCLSADVDISYPHGDAIAEAVRARGLNGILYSSARRAGGQRLVALRPHAVQDVTQGQIIRLRWTGGPDPEVTRDVKG